MEDAGAFLDALPVPAVLIGRDARIAQANARARELLGQGIRGRHFITALRRPDLVECVERVIADASPREARVIARDGDRDTLWRASVAPVGGGILISFEDRTDARDADQMRRDFVANVSHELRTPLTALLGYIETLQGPAREDAPARDRFLATMAREARRMNRLIDDLLSLSRVEQRARQRPTERVDLAQILAQVVTLLGPAASDAGVELIYDRPRDLPPIPGDADQLRQVFVNLVENAIKYGATPIEIGVEGPMPLPQIRGQGLAIRIRDHGPGIDPLHIPRLTERFYRVDSHRSREVGGTGLGLAIVKHIVARHRGRLRIDSRPDAGSVFSVSLPVEDGGASNLS